MASDFFWLSPNAKMFGERGAGVRRVNAAVARGGGFWGRVGRFCRPRQKNDERKNSQRRKQSGSRVSDAAEQFQVARRKGTEPPGTGEYEDTGRRQGDVYLRLPCGQPLF